MTETEMLVELATVKQQLRTLDRQSEEAAKLRVRVGKLTGDIHRLRQRRAAGETHD